MLYYVLEVPTAVGDECVHSLPHVWCNLAKSPCITETLHQARYCRFVRHRRIGECIPKLTVVR